LKNTISGTFWANAFGRDQRPPIAIKMRCGASFPDKSAGKSDRVRQMDAWRKQARPLVNSHLTDPR